MVGKARSTVMQRRIARPKLPRALLEHPATGRVGAASHIRRHIATAIAAQAAEPDDSRHRGARGTTRMGNCDYRGRSAGGSSCKRSRPPRSPPPSPTCIDCDLKRQAAPKHGDWIASIDDLADCSIRNGGRRTPRIRGRLKKPHVGPCQSRAKPDQRQGAETRRRGPRHSLWPRDSPDREQEAAKAEVVREAAGRLFE